MLKTTRRRLGFDALEGKVLLSAGMADPAKTVLKEAAKPLVLNGTLSGLPDGSPGVDGFTETSFPVGGRLASTGSVHGAFSLEHTFIPMGTLPDLAGATLTLENGKGSVELALTQGKKHEYKFTVVSGTKSYATAAGSGTLTLTSPASALNLVMKLHSTVVKKA